MLIFRSISLTFLFFYGGVHSTIASPDQIQERIDAYVAPLVEAQHFSGTILVAQGDEVLYERSFGLANRELGVLVGSRTLFGVGSVTKTMTRVIAYQLFEEGILSPEDNLSKWLPDFPQGEKITIEMLLKHEAGFVNHVSTDSQETTPLTAANIVELAKESELLFEPGSDSSYSSTGYSILARVLELARGLSYEDLLNKYVFSKAGMTDSQQPTGYSLIVNRASSYQFGGGGKLNNSPLKNYSSLVGSGSVFSTAHDLFRFMEAVVDGAMGPSAKENLVKEEGFSWGGLVSGYRTFADYDAETGIYIVVMSNVLAGAIDLLQYDLIRIVKGEDVALPQIPVHKAVNIDPDLLLSYAGDYQFRPGVVFTLSVERGEARMSGWILIPTSKTSFFSPQDYGEIFVILADDGSVERLDWTVGDFSAPMPRLPEN